MSVEGSKMLVSRGPAMESKGGGSPNGVSGSVARPDVAAG